MVVVGEVGGGAAAEEEEIIFSVGNTIHFLYLF